MLCLLSILRNDSSLRLQVCGYENTFNFPFQRLHSECMLDKSNKNLQTHLKKKIKAVEISFSEKQSWKSHFKLNHCFQIMLVNRPLLMWSVYGFSCLIYFYCWMKGCEKWNAGLSFSRRHNNPSAPWRSPKMFMSKPPEPMNTLH